MIISNNNKAFKCDICQRACDIQVLRCGSLTCSSHLLQRAHLQPPEHLSGVQLQDLQVRGNLRALLLLLPEPPGCPPRLTGRAHPLQRGARGRTLASTASLRFHWLVGATTAALVFLLEHTHTQHYTIRGGRGFNTTSIFKSNLRLWTRKPQEKDCQLQIRCNKSITSVTYCMILKDGFEALLIQPLRLSALPPTQTDGPQALPPVSPDLTSR